MKKYITILILLLSMTLNAAALQWFDGRHAVQYAVASDVSTVVDEALRMFSSDMEAVTGMAAHHGRHANIVIYQLDKANAKVIKELDKMNVLSTQLMDKHDAFFLGVHKDKIVIVGNNGRGTAYGIMELSRMAGVSPWIWWGDVKPQRQKQLTIDDKTQILQCPSVEYRGIFINDEDWSTRKWSHTTVEPNRQKGDIGPLTYRRIFELMLRLRANMLWPAMHEGTTAFFNVRGNKEMADSFAIVLGSSHCEPLLRNNVGEWDKAKRGSYNFISNRKSVEQYWAERLQQMKGSEAFFTIGMRGIHDGSMEGVKTPQEKFNGLQNVIDCQRQLISKNYNRNVSQVPQVFIPYKEVLEIYKQGLRVPDDVTLMWCDDNYGYMTRLSDAQEQQRKGGAGVYYHLSYWGRPHDYLWLTTTQPGLIYQEMRQAYDHNARKLWIVNVHDPKVAAYDLSLFMDMAWNINSVTPTTIRQHLRNWLTEQFGSITTERIMPAMEQFYKLTAMRRPEFMGWTQVELDKRRYPGGKSLPQETEFSETEFGGELLRYLEQYDEIAQLVSNEAEMRKQRLGDTEDASYFAHILYPVTCAAAMAHKFLDAQMEDTLSAMDNQAYIDDMTRRYNALSNGKWNGLMSDHPRDLPVFNNFSITDSTTIRCIKSRPINATTLEGCVVRNAWTYDESSGTVQSIDMLGHSQQSISIAKGSSLSYDFEALRNGNAVIRIAMIPTHAMDNGDIRYSVSLDGIEITQYSLKEPDRSERWKQNVLRGQALRSVDVQMTQGRHRITITALDDHIILDQWMLDYKKDRKFYVFPE